MWSVWKVYYMTYAEIEKHGDKPRELVASGLTLEKAKTLAATVWGGLGFRYSVHPEA